MRPGAAVLVLSALLLVTGCTNRIEGAAVAAGQAPSPAAGGQPPESTPPATNGESRLSGNWLENWPGLSYQDLFVISGTDAELTIDCPEEPTYIFEVVRFDGSKLHVEKKNDHGDGDPYLITYDLTLSVDGQSLTGTVSNDHGVSDEPVTWTRTDRTHGVRVN